jgi:hypothetical protein
MASRGQTTSLAERIEIGERWTTGQKDPEIAVAMNLPVWTVRKWRRKYQREGRSGLGSRLGRPPTGALGQFAVELRDTVRDLRNSHPGWGPITIRTELEGMPHFAGLKLPSRPRIAVFLHQHGLTRKYERHSQLPQPRAVAAQRAHEEWEVDAQGVIQVSELGAVSIINISDLFSRVKLESLPCLRTSHPSTRDYQQSLSVSHGLASVAHRPRCRGAVHRQTAARRARGDREKPSDGDPTSHRRTALRRWGRTVRQLGATSRLSQHALSFSFSGRPATASRSSSSQPLTPPVPPRMGGRPPRHATRLCLLGPGPLVPPLRSSRRAFVGQLPTRSR